MSAHTCILFALVALSSCRAIGFEELHPVRESAPLFPALQVVIDTSSLKMFYWNDPSMHQPAEVRPAADRHNQYYDVRVQDAMVLFNREVKDNLTDPLDETYGYITLKVTTGECRFSTFSAVISLATLFIPSLFGLPISHHMTHLELEVELYDAKEKLLGRYTATGYSRTPIALWRGYRTSDACRLSNIGAFKQAMQEIKTALQAEYPELHMKLLMAGPVAKR